MDRSLSLQRICNPLVNFHQRITNPLVRFFIFHFSFFPVDNFYPHSVARINFSLIFEDRLCDHFAWNITSYQPGNIVPTPFQR